MNDAAAWAGGSTHGIPNGAGGSAHVIPNPRSG